MTGNIIQYSYGPVPSRRLGKSLGINNIPPKICTYSCVYCQVGRTTGMRKDRLSFYEPEAIFQDVRQRLQKARESSEQVDYLAFVPDGEPTLDLNLGKAITLLKELSVPIGVITNSSLLDREDVRTDLAQADWVSLKVDSVQETIWRRMNRPHGALKLPLILEGIRRFSESFKGTLVTETMLAAGINDNDESMSDIADFLGELQPDHAYLSIPIRPPAEGTVHIPDEATLNRMYHILAQRVNQVEYLIGYEGNAFASSGDTESDLLGITSVHPMREDAVGLLLYRNRSSWDIIDRLIDEGALTKTSYDGHIFYLRRTRKDCGFKQ